MLLLLNTSTPICKLTLVKPNGMRRTEEWEAGRSLAKGLLAFVRDTLASEQASFTDVAGLGVYRGPGSFTGLRIGITVLNTIADSQNISIVGATGDSWMDTCVARLHAGETDGIVLPLYGRDANITTPRK